VFGGIYLRNYRVNVVWGDLRDEGVWGLGLLRAGMKGEGIPHYGGIGYCGGVLKGYYLPEVRKSMLNNP
jgi:hypothetical protein